jgi:hypothetical protein
MAGRRTIALAGVLILAAGMPVMAQVMAQFETPAENAAPNRPQPQFGNPNASSAPRQPQFSNPGGQPAFAAPTSQPQFGGSQFGGAPGGGQQQQRPACIDQIEKLKQGAEKSAAALRGAQKRKPTPAEGCKLFSNFSGAFGAYVNYLAKEASACGVPPDAVKNLRVELAKINDTKTKVCQMASRPQGPGPASLSGALSGPITAEPGKVKPGRGTFDTLTGNALGR